MARYDKYDPMVGGYRAPLAADWSSNDVGRPFGVGMNSSGQVVKGNGNTGITGILILTKVRKAGDIVDVMTAGEIIEWDPVTAGTAGVAGTPYFADATTGAITVTSATGKTKVGVTAEATRIIVRTAGTVVP